MFNYILVSVCPVKPTRPALGYCSDDNAFHSLEPEWVVAAPELGFTLEEIGELLKDAILVHYYYRKGCIEGALSHDKDVLKAIEILSSTAEYNRILGK